MDREKVISGLQHCVGGRGCYDCPYTDCDSCTPFCKAQIMRDALELLKAQEPRVMTLDEVRELQGDTVVWLEDKDKTDVVPAIVNHVWNSLPNIVSFTLKNMREVKTDILWYRFKWRIWTSRPDEKRRAETPWN